MDGRMGLELPGIGLQAAAHGPLLLVVVRRPLLLVGVRRPLLLATGSGPLLLPGRRDVLRLLLRLLLLLDVRLVVDAGVLAVLAVVVIILRRRGQGVPVQVVGVASDHWRRHGDAGARGLESTAGRSAVLDGPKFARLVHVTVLAVHLAGRVLGLDFERAVRVLVTVAVRTVLVLSVHLFQDRDRLGSRRGRGCQSATAHAKC